ncbi:MAG: hypothetical protein AB1456_01175, partial [Thermodesulfobacteriota bacterium]
MADTAPASRPGFVVVTHGRLGEELLRVARYILGERLDRFRAVEVPFMGEMQPAPAGERPFADRREKIRIALAAAASEVDQGGGVLILTDILGGTSSNVAQEVLTGRDGAVIAGVNLPMLLKAASLEATTVAEAADE